VRILRLPGVQSKTGLGRDSIYRGGREGWFPKPVKINQRSTGWIESEVDAFIERRMRERDQAAGAPNSQTAAA
jgi:prophage regulatory protein